MTPQERDVLLPLLDKLRQARVPDKDTEADQLIRQTMGEQPDAAYILAQTVLMQDYALHQAQARIQQLEQSPRSSSSGGFLAGLFGGGSPVPATQTPPQPQPNRPWGQPTAQGAYTPQSTYAQPMMTAMQPGYGQPSFLRSAAQTAVGIAGGALLFDGIEHLMGGGGMMGGGMMGGGFGGGGFVPQQDIVENTTVNNYYDQPAPDSDAGVQGGDGSDMSGNDFVDTSGGDDSFGI